MKIIATLSNSVIKNIVVANDNDLLTNIANLNECDYALDITDLNPRPGLGAIKLEDGSWSTNPTYLSWIWDGESWQAPTPKPDEENHWQWDEKTLSWQLLNNDN